MSYVETNFGFDGAEYQYDFRRINWSMFPSEFDSAKVFRIGKESPLGNTVFTLGVYSDDKLQKAVPVSVGVTMIVDALVTTVPIGAGEKLHGLVRARRAITGKNQQPVTDMVLLEGKQTRRYIPAGSIIFPSMYEEIPVISPGDRINIVIEKGLIKITAEGVARQKGGIGDFIRVVNLGSNQIVKAEVIDSTTVAVK